MAIIVRIYSEKRKNAELPYSRFVHWNAGARTHLFLSRHVCCVWNDSRAARHRMTLVYTYDTDGIKLCAAEFYFVNTKSDWNSVWCGIDNRERTIEHCVHTLYNYIDCLVVEFFCIVTKLIWHLIREILYKMYRQNHTLNKYCTRKSKLELYKEIIDWRVEDNAATRKLNCGHSGLENHHEPLKNPTRN